MNYIVPEFGTANDDYLIPELPDKSMMGENEDVMELLWNNGQVLMQGQNQSQSQNQKTKKPETRAPVTTGNEIKSAMVEDETRPSDLFMQEDEMASWLHFPVVDDDNNNNSLLGSYLYNNNDILYPTTVDDATVTTSVPPLPPPSVKIPSSQPPVPTYKRMEGEVKQPKFTNFGHFSKAGRGRGLELGQPSTSKVGPASRPSTNIMTPGVEAQESRGSSVSVSEKPTRLNVKSSGGTSGVFSPGPSSTRREIETCEISVTSSHGTGGSGESAGIEPTTQEPPVPTDDRKRKSRDTDDMEYCNEDVEFVYPDEKKQSHGASTSMKRSRAAEVHNLSERKRRDRINEKMKALQELIPHCNKSDKASMLDEAIEYLKSLQMQVQMMSMGYGMVPMMFPGVQQYVPQMAMGMGMGIHRTMVPYPAILQGSSMHNPAVVAAAAANLGQCFPVPGYNMSPVTVADPTTSQAANMTAPTMSSFPLNNQNQPRLPSFVDPFQQYLGLQQAQLQVPLSQGMEACPQLSRVAAPKMQPTLIFNQTS